MAQKITCKYCKEATGFSRFLDVSTSKDGVCQRIACEKCFRILIVLTVDKDGNFIQHPFPM